LELVPPIEPAGLDDASAALAAYLRVEEDELQVQRAGWRRVAEDADQVLFVTTGRPGGDSRFIMVAFSRRGGGWEFDTAGACHATVVFPGGVDTAEWWLDPDRAPPDPDDRHVAALVGERTCASGRPPIGRVLPPVVLFALDAVVVAFSTRPLPGGQDCPGAPPAPVEFDLAEPLGDRLLLDGGVFPPRDARVPPDGR
jgi:hypothetical protein